jgi:hypothetical protein
MGMLFSLKLLVPFFDTVLIDLGMRISPDLKIVESGGEKIEKWIRCWAPLASGPDSILPKSDRRS